MSASADEPQPSSRWRRPRTWILVAVIAVVGWFLVAGIATVHHARQADNAISGMVQNIAAGNPQAAAESIQTARDNTADVQSGLTAAPLSALRVIPYVRTNFDGADTLMTATDQVLDAAEVTNALYADLSGANGAQTAAFSEGTINIDALEGIGPQVDQITADLDRADQTLAQLPPDVSPKVRDLAGQAQAQVDGIQKGLSVYQKIRPELPVLLGRDSPATYLVVFHNPGELFAGGGAALNVAVLRFDNGKMDVIDKGAVSTHFFPGNPRVPWDPEAQGPYFETSGAKDGFAWSNLHQDYRISGEDLMRSWVANGGTPVDGVISLDPAALAAAVAATGPIESPLYGQITADNLVSKLFYEGYNEDPVAQEKRHAVNQQLIDEMLTRMQDGNTALTIGRAIFATAAGHHIRIHLSDNRLAKALHEAQVDGGQPDAEPDRIAFFTQNQNASKVDIFQTRSVEHKVQLAEDGSAAVEQTAVVTNNAPENGSPPEDRIGYTTRWAFHWNIVLLPAGARDVRIDAQSEQVRRDDRVFTDVDGRKAVRIGTWIPAGGNSRITVTYRLAKGTFGTAGNLEYRTSVEYQLMVNPTELTVDVAGPSQPAPVEGEWTVDGERATTRFPVTQPLTLALGYGQPS